MRIIRSIKALPKQPVVATVGNFDGVHLGHQRVLRSLQEAKQRIGGNAQSLVLSFYPHPAVVLGRVASIPKITRLKQFVEELTKLDVDLLYKMRFTKALAQVSAEDFIERFLIAGLGISHFIIGPDSAFGRGREGSPEFIEEYLQRRGISSERVGLLEHGSEKISSREIREQLYAGDVAHAAKLLGRPFALYARIVKGDGRGSQIGIPTANLARSNQLLPKEGVYTTAALIDGVRLPSVSNIGRRPTFQGQEVRVETHILDTVQDSLRGKHIELEFLSRIREEKKFADAQALVSQIHQDMDTAKAYFKVRL